MAYPAETNDGTVTSWIPLTTLYTPSKACSNYFRLEGPSLVAFDPAYGFQVDPSVDCQPSAVTTWWEQGLLLPKGTIASDHTAVSILPLTCPIGWSTVATSTLSGISTLAMCCPNEYTLNNQDPGSVDGNCWSNVPSGKELTYASTADDDTMNWVTATTTFGASSFVGAIAIVGWNVQQRTMIPASTTMSSSTSSSTGTTMSTIPRTSSGSRTASNTASTLSISQSIDAAASSDPLSTGAKAGIGLGAALGFIGVLALVIVVVVLLRGRKAAQAPANVVDTNPFEEEKKDSSMAKKSQLLHSDHPGFHEIPNSGLHELYDHSQPQELPAIGSPVELDHRRGVF